MSENPDPIAQVWNDAVGQHIAGLSDTEYSAMVNRFRPTVRQSLAAKASQLGDLSQQCGDGQGWHGMSDAAAARAPKTDAPQVPPELAVQHGITPNRAQAHSSGQPEDSERDRNARLIDTIREGGLPR